MMENFLDQIEDFLECGAKANTMTYGNLFNVFVFGYDNKTLTMISNSDKPSVAIFDGDMYSIPDDFITHALETLQPTEIKKC